MVCVFVLETNGLLVRFGDEILACSFWRLVAFLTFRCMSRNIVFHLKLCPATNTDRTTSTINYFLRTAWNIIKSSTNSTAKLVTFSMVRGNQHQITAYAILA